MTFTCPGAISIPVPVGCAGIKGGQVTALCNSAQFARQWVGNLIFDRADPRQMTLLGSDKLVCIACGRPIQSEDVK